MTMMKGRAYILFVVCTRAVEILISRVLLDAFAESVIATSEISATATQAVIDGVSSTSISRARLSAISNVFRTHR